MNVNETIVTTLSNGLKVVCRQVETQAEYCGVFINAGSRDETKPRQFGTAHFIEHTIFKSTLIHPASYVLNRMEETGGELTAYTTKEETAVYSIFPEGHLDRAVELLAELITSAAFKPDELDNEREVVLDEVLSYRDNPAEAVYDDFDELFFKGNPLAHNILGTSNSIKNFTTKSCAAFRDRFYVASNMVFFYLGPKPPFQVVKTVTREMSGIPVATEPVPERVAPEAVEPFDKIIRIGSHQSHNLLGARICSRNSDERFAFSLLANMLAGPGMNSLLNVALREKNGLVYTVEASPSFYSDCGQMTIYYGCDKKDSTRCRDLIFQEIERVAAKKLSDDELQRFKAQFVGQATVGRDNYEQEALTLGRRLLFGFKPASPNDILRRIEPITADQLAACAERLLPPFTSRLRME